MHGFVWNFRTTTNKYLTNAIRSICVACLVWCFVWFGIVIKSHGLDTQTASNFFSILFSLCIFLHRYIIYYRALLQSQMCPTNVFVGNRILSIPKTFSALHECSLMCVQSEHFYWVYEAAKWSRLTIKLIFMCFLVACVYVHHVHAVSIDII